MKKIEQKQAIRESDLALKLKLTGSIIKYLTNRNIFITTRDVNKFKGISTLNLNMLYQSYLNMKT